MADLAHIHMRVVTGAVVVPMHLNETLPKNVVDVLREEEFDDDPTPVTEPFKKNDP